MGKRSKKVNRSQANQPGFAVVAFANDWEQAKEYETLLKVNDIPAIIRAGKEDSEQVSEIAIMVPEDYLDEAHVVIESQDAYDDFYDFSIEDDEGDFDGDFLDDDF